MTPANNHTRQTSGQRRNKACRALIPLLLALTPSFASGFDLDSDTPIRVSADSARLDDGQGIATYTGTVEMNQGNSRLTADRVVLYRNDVGVRRIEADGEPARYRQPAANGEGETDAEALTITWSADDNRVTFEREAVITQDGNVFRGDLIHYNSVERVVTAEGSAEGSDGSGRVEMVIQPRSSGNSSDNADKQEPDGRSESQ